MSIRRDALTLALALALTASGPFGPPREAHAQTMSHTGMLVAPNNQCVDLQGSFTASAPPPAGTRAVLSRCDGRPAQRWFAVFGDSNFIRGLGGLMLSARVLPGASPGHYRVELVVGQAGPDARGVVFNGSNLQLHGGQCVALVSGSGGPALELAPCSQQPEVRWSMR